MEVSDKVKVVFIVNINKKEIYVNEDVRFEKQVHLDPTYKIIVEVDFDSLHLNEMNFS